MGNLASSFARVRLEFVSTDIGPPDSAKRIRGMIERAIAEAEAGGGWIKIYEARRLTILLLSPDETVEALVAALSELMMAQVPGAAALQKAFDDLKPQGANLGLSAAVQSRLRLLLLDVVEAIQWDEQKRYLTRQVTREAANRLVRCWAITFILFVLPYISAVLAIAFFKKTDLSLDAWMSIVPWMVLGAGLMGALFSRLIYLQSNWTSLSLDQVEDARQWSSILLRGSVGMCAAVLVFLFLRSNIAGGELLPNLEKVGLAKLKLEDTGSMKLAFLAPTPHFALLIIWCFLAGFSERFVQDILAASEKKLSAASSK
jgi:hypothetical protein